MRIAHLSDLHLLSLDGARALDFAGKRLLGGINLALNRGRHYSARVFEAMVDDVNAQGVDHVACTGDLTNLALESEFRFAREHFDRFRIGPAAVTCIPGNHDGYVPAVRGVFETTFAPYCAPDEGWGWNGAGHWPVVRMRGDVAIIAVSTSRPTHLLAAYGEVGAEQLARLDRVLGDPRLDGYFRLVLVHHPPVGRGARSMLRGFRDRAAFVELVARHGAELVLHGHEHLDVTHEITRPTGGSILVRGIQAGTYDGGLAERQSRYRIYTVARGAAGRPTVVGEELRIYRSGTHTFAQDSARAA